MMNKLLGIKTWYNPRLIPNRPNYQFIGRLTDNTLVKCETYRHDFGVRIGVRTTESKTVVPFDNIDQWTDVN